MYGQEIGTMVNDVYINCIFDLFVDMFFMKGESLAEGLCAVLRQSLCLINTKYYVSFRWERKQSQGFALLYLIRSGQRDRVRRKER